MAKVIASTYEIIEKIGSGGGGNVYVANHLRLGKKVVLKADKRKITTRPELLRREVDILKELRHSYIPQVYDFFIEDDIVYTVMDFIEGESLDKPLKRGERFSQSQVIQWAEQLLEALCYLHSPTHGNPPRGFVHSDIKPANLMRTQDNNICLIDFNITLALGEENIVGRSAGYASPEHYGLDYSKVSGVESVTIDDTETMTDHDGTLTIDYNTDTVTLTELQSKTVLKKVTPDVRSDIYSVGATLYHLLSGRRPAKSATEVVPLSEKEFSPQVVRIITKAMNLNPDMRYQSAAEMLYDFTHLHENDPRTKRMKRNNRIAGAAITVMFCVGALSAFVGLKRMQSVERGLKLAEYSHNALTEGDVSGAMNFALEAIPKKTGLLTPENEPEAQKALTDALAVYDLEDGFKKAGRIELSKNPVNLAVSPDGRVGVCICENEMVVFDTENELVIATLQTVDSALAEIEFEDSDTIIYAGEKGISAYRISENRVLWEGDKATAISISQDGKTAAAVYKDESHAVIYDVETGQKKTEIDFEGKKQSVTMVSDSFANPDNNLFELNDNGTLLAVSFSDGTIGVYNLQNNERELSLLEDNSGYTWFEGGFEGNYLAFSAVSEEKSIFGIIDVEQKIQTIGFESESTFHVKTYQHGIYLQTKNVLVKIDPVSGEQTPLVTTDEKIWQFAVGDDYTVVSTQDQLLCFNKNAQCITELEEEMGNSLLKIANGVVLNARIDMPVVNVIRYKENTQAEVMSYDASLEHDEARISDDNKTVMLFSYKQFYICDLTGKVISEVILPNSEEVYDQQFIREENNSYLEVRYKDGKVLTYDAKNGELLAEAMEEKPDMTLNEAFFTEDFRIEAPLHGVPQIYDIETGKKVYELQEDAYLTYITQVDEYIIAQYITAEGVRYGTLLNNRWEQLAQLPYLSDVKDGELYFDYPDGSLKKSPIYDKETLTDMAEKIVELDKNVIEE